MALPEPTTAAPGKLVIIYRQDLNPHRMAMNLCLGVDPSDSTAMDAEAHNAADAFVVALGADCYVLGYEVTSVAGDYMYGQTFVVAQQGLSNINAGSLHSATVTFIGRGATLDTGVRKGGTRLVMFAGNGAVLAAGVKRVATAGYTGFDAVQSYLDSTDVCWADKYGQKASCKAYATVQFNASAQARIGS